MGEEHRVASQVVLNVLPVDKKVTRQTQQGATSSSLKVIRPFPVQDVCVPDVSVPAFPDPANPFQVNLHVQVTFLYSLCWVCVRSHSVLSPHNCFSSVQDLPVHIFLETSWDSKEAFEVSLKQLPIDWGHIFIASALFSQSTHSLIL